MRQFKYLIFILLFACNDPDVMVDSSSLGYQYFPLETGDYRVYQVNAVQYFFNNPPDTVTYQLLEKATESFQDLSGKTAYRLERFKRTSEMDVWKIDSVWIAKRNAYTATQVEHNIPIIKLSFPVKENKRWDANTFNDKPVDQYELRNIEKSFKLMDSTIFAKTITVVQDSITDNILFKNIKKEVFSENIGLIYKEITLLNFCADVECVGQDIVETGIEYRQWMIDYGKE